MASYYDGYQTDEDKYKNVANVFIRKKKTGRKDVKGDEFWDNFIEYVTYYKDNPHRFCAEYLGLPLHYWQQEILYAMWTRESTIFLAGRGSGKTYLTMLYCICKCLLYPGIQIRVASANKKQSALLVAKIKEMQRNSPMLAREIADVYIGKDEAKITFHGGGEVSTVVASDNARGERASVVIVDEREIVDKEIIDKVFIPFLTAKRNPTYLNKKEYKHLSYLETNHFIEMSSIGSTTSSMYVEYLQYLSFIAEGKSRGKYAVFSIPYQIPLRSGVVNKSIIEKMVREATSSVEAFRQEMEVVPTGEGKASMFTYEQMNKNRKLRMPLIPISDDEFLEYNGNIKKSKHYQEKMHGEMRILSYDIARSMGRKNDESVFIVFRLFPNGDYYDKEIAYIETMNGVDTEKQILRLKQLFYDLNCDRCVADVSGIGSIFLDYMLKVTEDFVRNKRYPAWKPINNMEKHTQERIILPNSEQVLYTLIVSGNSAQQVQANMVQTTRFNFDKKRLRLLMNEDDVTDELQKRFKIINLKSSPNRSENEEAARILASYRQTNKLIQQGIDTQVEDVKSGGISINEGTGLKDMVMCLIYGMYYISLLEQDLTKPQKKFDWSNYILY